MKRCNRCIMPEVEGTITINEKGICNICEAFDKTFSNNTTKIEPDKNKLLQKVNKYRNKKSYDCIVGVSGGKDSIMTLKIAKEELGLNPLGVLVDNGFLTDIQMQNATNAADILNIDLIINKTNVFKNIFKELLINNIPVYYCRICHAIIDKIIRDTALAYDIKLILGGYTKGQDYIKQKELFWIYNQTDKNFKSFFTDSSDYGQIVEMFPNLIYYFAKKYSSIKTISPFWYMDWDEDEIIETLTKELNFKTPEVSWPDKSSNCLFNFISQYKAQQEFGYTQHETELSVLVRKNELSRERALTVINTPITKEEIQLALDRINLKYTDIFN